MKYSILVLFAFGIVSVVCDWPPPPCDKIRIAIEEPQCAAEYVKLTMTGGGITFGGGNPAAKLCSTGQDTLACIHKVWTKYCGILEARDHIREIGGYIGAFGYDPNEPECQKLKYIKESGDAATLEMASLKQLVALAAAVVFAARIAFLR
ncbi:hypothetical protein Ddc_23161 [Ditylenchus destructor]|nr:hypothetical protein Ddc_23161 [Ditylenchus destructor]